MTRRRRLITWICAALAVCGADCEYGNDPRQPPEVRQEATLRLQTYVETKYSPYDVYLSITGGDGVYPSHIPVASGGWKHDVIYQRGKTLTITMTVEPSKNGSRDGYCSITDGHEYVRDDVAPVRSSERHLEHHRDVDIAICILTTSQ